MLGTLRIQQVLRLYYKQCISCQYIAVRQRVLSTTEFLITSRRRIMRKNLRLFAAVLAAVMTAGTVTAPALAAEKEIADEISITAGTDEAALEEAVEQEGR